MDQDDDYCHRLIHKWIAELGPDAMDEYVEPAGGYKTFNQFFIRTLKEARPVSGKDDDSIVACPADAIVNMVADNLTLDTKLQVKTQELDVQQLLNNSPLASNFVGGTAISCILMPDVYHHYHSPVSGKVVESEEDVAGNYFGIEDFPALINNDNVGYGYDYSVFEHFRRGYLIIQTKDYGYVAMIPVGLNTIASVIFDKQWKKITSENDPVSITKGEHVGYFQYGGSLNILLFEQNCFPGMTIPQGQMIGSLQPKTTKKVQFSF